MTKIKVLYLTDNDENNNQSKLQTKSENFELKRSGLIFEDNVNIVVRFSQTEKMGGTSYTDLLYNQSSVKNPQLIITIIVHFGQS